MTVETRAAQPQNHTEGILVSHKLVPSKNQVPSLYPRTAADRQKLRSRQEDGEIVFFAHPHLHTFPWSVPDKVANRHVLKALKKQPFRRYKGHEYDLTAPITKLEKAAASSGWQTAALQQLPRQLWGHHNELTEYQVWVGYRAAVRQLRLHYEGKKENNSCRKLPSCQGQKETLEHILWDCLCAKGCWQQLISHWTGDKQEQAGLQQYQEYCTSRQAPAMSNRMRLRLQRTHPDEQKEFAEEWRKIWWIMSSICITSLWGQRNRVVFRSGEVTKEGSVQEYWATGIRQLHAVAKRDSRNADRMIRGTWLMQCLQDFTRQPREPSPQATSPVQLPDHTLAPALLTRLRTYQTSCTR